MNRGIFLGLGAYLIWGFMPIWLRQIKEVPALQILSHRIIWSLVLLAIFVLSSGQWEALRKAATTRRNLLIYLTAAFLLSANWLTYIYAVNSDHIVEASLGYFINPLVNVLFGIVLFRERLRTWQWVPIGIAGLGVAYLTFDYGRLPWIAITLALTFASYAVVKKAAPLGSLYGLTLETALLFVPALGYLAMVEMNGGGAFGHQGWIKSLLLAFAGVITAVPLLMFGEAARRIPLSMLGLLQYVAPSCQFLIGVLVYREPFTLSRLFGFAIIWVALILFWFEGYVHLRLKKEPIVLSRQI